MKAMTGAPMQVLTLTPFYPTAGDSAAGCFIAEPLPLLEKFGVKSRVIAVQPFYRNLKESMSAIPPATWVRYPCLPSGLGLSSAGSLLYAKLLASVRELHRQQPIDVIHAHAALPCGHAAVLLSGDLGIPTVITIHGLDAYFTRQVRGIAGKLCQSVSNFVYGSAARLIGVSQRVCDQLSKGNPSQVNATVIYNGVNPAVFHPSREAPGDVIILSVGNLIPTKGHELLLRSFAEVLNKFPHAQCEIIGDGPERSRLDRLSDQLGIAKRVQFLGRQNRDQVAEAMRRCSVFALPSSYEGLGCVYLEAMSAEKPVIACRGQGIDEVIEDGSNGMLVAADDRVGLSIAIESLLKDESLRKKIGEAARRTVLQNFTLEGQAERLAVLYRECVA